MSSTFVWDTREQDIYLRKFTAKEADKLLRKATTAGATAAKRVMITGAPIGTGEREGQFYRRNGAGHGTFRSSIDAKAIRRRGIQANTIASIIGPMGKFGFIRAWRESGTKPHGKHPGSKGTHYIEQEGPRAFEAARVASESILLRYGAEKR